MIYFTPDHLANPQIAMSHNNQVLFVLNEHTKQNQHKRKICGKGEIVINCKEFKL